MSQQEAARGDKTLRTPCKLMASCLVMSSCNLVIAVPTVGHNGPVWCRVGGKECGREGDEGGTVPSLLQLKPTIRELLRTEILSVNKPRPL